jgi:hypothetical protein
MQAFNRVKGETYDAEKLLRRRPGSNGYQGALA